MKDPVTSSVIAKDAAAFNKFLKTLFPPHWTLKLPFFLFLSDVFHLWYKDSCHLKEWSSLLCVCVGQQEEHTEEEAQVSGASPGCLNIWRVDCSLEAAVNGVDLGLAFVARPV